LPSSVNRLRLEPLEVRAVPTILHVGPTQQYTKPSQAAAVAQDGDDIQIDAGTYTSDTAVWSANNLTIEGVGGRAVLDDTGYAIPNRKGIFVITGANITVRNITFQGAHDGAGADRNWAGIRQQGGDLTVLDCAFLHNDDGILATPAPAYVDNSNLVVQRTEFGFNGYGDGFSHNMYVNQVGSFTLTDSYTHDSVVGHLIKSRAAKNVIEYNRIQDNQGTGSYEVDLPNGGESYLIGNVIEQGPNTQNPNVVAYAEEGATNAVQKLYVVNNTLVNDRTAGGTFVWVSGTPADARVFNNIFAGTGTTVSGAVTQNDHNLTTTAAIFVDPAAGDYHLQAGAAAIDAGADPGTANGFDLTPRFEPTAPLQSTARPVVGPLDLGAFEYAATQPPAAPTGLTATPGDAQVSLTWAAAAGATGYNLYRGTASGGEVLIQSGVAITAYTDTGLANGTAYYYQVTAVNAGGESGRSGEASATPTAPSVPPVPPPPIPPPPVSPPPGGRSPGLVGFPQFAVGADVGSSVARFFNPDGSERFTVDAFPGFTGGVRVAAADFNGDGVADLVVGTGPGGPTHVRVLDGVTQAVLFAVDPFEPSFTGGVFVAAGDLNGDGRAELVVTPDEGGGPRVRVFGGNGFGQLADFFGIADPDFRGGARAAIGDVNGDGFGDLIVAAGFGGGPRVAGFDGRSVVAGNTSVKLFADFFVFEQTLRNGVFVAAGDLNGDGFADVIAGGGPGGGPRVFALSGKDLVAGTQTQVANFFAGDTNNRGGIRVAIKNLDGDNQADLVIASGTGAGSRVTGYLGKTIAAGGTPPEQFAFDAFAWFSGGVFVG
jgi:hypothetical protein